MLTKSSDLGTSGVRVLCLNIIILSLFCTFALLLANINEYYTECNLAETCGKEAAKGRRRISEASGVVQ